MGRRTATWLAAASWFLYVALAAMGLVFAFLNRPTGPATGLGPALGPLAALTVFLAFPTVGLLIAARQPTNPIGWIFCAQGLAFALIVFCDGYARYTIDHPGSLPGGVVMAWLCTLLWLPASALGIVLLLLVFPTGWLLSKGWRLWAAVIDLFPQVCNKDVLSRWAHVRGNEPLLVL